MGTVSHRKYIKWHPDEASEPTSTVVLTSPENRFVDLRILLPPGGSDKLSQDPSSFLSSSWIPQNPPQRAPATAVVVFLFPSLLLPPPSSSSPRFPYLSPALLLVSWLTFSEPTTAGQLPLDRLDWAIAGTTSSEAATAPTGEAIRRATFRHWVSSRHADPRGVSDVGDMYPQHGSSTTLERGVMVNPATGLPTPYDELWTDLLAPTSDPIAVLRVDQDGGGPRGMVIWIGTLCQALVRDGESISLERWEKSEASVGDDDDDEAVVDEGAWTRTVRMGDRELPCEEILTGKVMLEKDGVVACQGDMWEVVELHR
ncbi:sodium/nucleoside cotransporter [Cordyceps fumosorosea ARSEF 2679]|uniref:Protein HRI1 n=1 Tax=Cordyceps fumosorosea (strain ARSEF 2679) TaxID=1081104 RepID=A0A167VXK8_CORFA|nr:sodium/nucleoside cotransporter [Cordyceps fumosorosea ARSEF 2679]OAA63093.1 sodium/nucleoside cotransporter [Cordyceps fumosorosea ARSEF 2679]